MLDIDRLNDLRSRGLITERERLIAINRRLETDKAPIRWGRKR